MSLTVLCAAASFSAPGGQLLTFQGFGELMDIFLVVSNRPWQEYLQRKGRRRPLSPAPRPQPRR